MTAGATITYRTADGPRRRVRGLCPRPGERERRYDRCTADRERQDEQYAERRTCASVEHRDGGFPRRCPGLRPTPAKFLCPFTGERDARR